MRIIFTLMLLILSNLALAQTVITIESSVLVKLQPNENSKTLQELPKGYLLHLTGEAKDTWRQTNLGWIQGESLLVVREESLIQPEAPGKNWYTEQLAAKNPADLTSTEIQYLIYSEKQKDEQLRKDIRFFRNVTIVGIIIGAVSTIATGVVLSNQL